MTAMENLGSLWNNIQAQLFPMLEDELGELDKKHREFIAVCEFCSPRAYLKSYRWVGNGWRPEVQQQPYKRQGYRPSAWPSLPAVRTVNSAKRIHFGFAGHTHKTRACPSRTGYIRRLSVRWSRRQTPHARDVRQITPRPKNFSRRSRSSAPGQ